MEDHFNSRHSPLSLEESWATKDWKHCVFSFIISLVEVNARLSHGYFNDELPLPQVLFWKQLAREQIRRGKKKMCEEEEEVG